MKKVQKNFNNYASVECGAKILGANPEAKVHYPMLNLHLLEDAACPVKCYMYERN